MMDQNFINQLESGLAALGLEANTQQIEQLSGYIALLVKWNKAYNLTAIRDPQQMLALHILDSLSIGKLISGQSLIDVGAGAGLPGIPLAIMHPDRNFVLLDSNGKKVRFLFQAISSLKLGNVSEKQQRVETYQPSQPFDSVLSRAYASIIDMVTSCSHLLSSKGHFFAMKGKYPESELSQLPKGYIVNSVQPISVPGIDGQRHLVDLSFSEESV